MLKLYPQHGLQVLKPYAQHGLQVLKLYAQHGLQVLKLYAWESAFRDKVLALRKKEVEVLLRVARYNAASVLTWTCAPYLVSRPGAWIVTVPCTVVVPLGIFVGQHGKLTVYRPVGVGLLSMAVTPKAQNKMFSKSEMQ